MKRRAEVIVFVVSLLFATSAFSVDPEPRDLVAGEDYTPAEIGTLSGAVGVKPWAIPDFDYVVGQEVLFKSGSSDPPSASSSFFYCVDFPPLNKGIPLTGSSVYMDNIIYGSDGVIEIGDQLQVEPGNQAGPTKAGVDQLVAMDPNATWNISTNQIDNSWFPEFTSPRVCKISMYDPSFPPEVGRNYVTVVRLGAIFLEGIQGKDIVGRVTPWEQSGVPADPGWPTEASVRLSAPYPQPSMGEVSLLLSLGQTTDVSLEVFDIRGRLVKRLAQGLYGPGAHDISWDGTDRSHERVSPGIYFCRMEAGVAVQTQKMILAR